jgi:hypothetical protein
MVRQAHQPSSMTTDTCNDLKTTSKIFDFKPLQNIFMNKTLSFFGCKQPYFGTSFVAGGDFVLNTCNGGAKYKVDTNFST